MCISIAPLIGFIVLCNRHEFSQALMGENVRKANANEFPFIVTIGIKYPIPIDNHVCTGSLISPKHVLTSAHCIISRDHEYNDLVIKVGTTHIRSGKRYDVKSVLTYRDWAEKYHAVSFRFNDIAILQLFERVNVPEVMLGRINKKTCTTNFVNKTVVTAGWGEIDFGDSPKNLRTASLRVLSTRECADRIFRATTEKYNSFASNMCTSADPYVVLGLGDSGGPLLRNGVIIGINELIYPNSTDLSIATNLHTAISFYTEFIDWALKLN